MKYRIAIIWIAKKCYVILTHPGFIPVFTENMSTLPQYYLGDPVYPCVYREHVSSFSLASRWDGLSLCIQGTHINHWFHTVWIRFIPVYTGNVLLIIVIREKSGLSLCIQGTPIITYCFINKILTTKFLPIFLAIFYQNHYL